MTIAPGSTIGVLGGGQLGRMTAMAAAELGYRTIVFAPEEDCIAADVAARWIRAPYADETALRAFAEQVDIVTIEFENVPAQALRMLARQVPTRPGATILEISQDRLTEKRFLESSGAPVAPYRSIGSIDELEAAVRELGEDAILKTRRLGYDGKGQVRLAETGLAQALVAIDNAPAILEARVSFERELSVVTARSPAGQITSYPPVANEHRDQILRLTRAPADLPSAVAAKAVKIAERIAGAMCLEGLVAVEMFLMGDGEILVNEIAPRPHNSGHWTMDACPTSQFEQLIRAICDLPLGVTAPLAAAEMENLIGDDIDRWTDILLEPSARLHLYGKKAVRPGRKMGHVTRLRPPQAIMSG